MLQVYITRLSYFNCFARRDYYFSLFLEQSLLTFWPLVAENAHGY